MKRRFTAVALIAIAFIAACGLNSVTKAQLTAVKVGDVLTFRYQKDGKSWFYCEKITRVDGDKVYYNAGKNESTSGKDARLKDYDSRELLRTRAELEKFETEQGDEQRKVIWIE